MKKLSVSVAILLVLALTGCGDDLSQQLESRKREAEVKQLAELKDLLSGAPLASDVEIFLSGSLLNSALTQIGTSKVQIKQLGDAVLTLSDIHIAFNNGYPALSLKAIMDSPSRGISADCAVDAILYLNNSAATLDQTTFRVAINSIAPQVRVGWLQFSIRGFWNDLAKLAAQNQLSNLPEFSVPLSASAPVKFGGPAQTTLPAGSGTVTGTLSLPPGSATVSAHLAHALFLQDGVHLYLDTEVK